MTENDYRIVIDGETIVILEINNIESGFGRIYGKTINSKIINENSSDKEKRITFSAIIGTLSSFKHFIKSIEDQFHLKVKKFYFEKKEIKIDGEDKSFSSLGINHYFECLTIFDN